MSNESFIAEEEVAVDAKIANDELGIQASSELHFFRATTTTTTTTTTSTTTAKIGGLVSSLGAEIPAPIVEESIGTGSGNHTEGLGALSGGAIVRRGANFDKALIAAKNVVFTPGQKSFPKGSYPEGSGPNLMILAAAENADKAEAKSKIAEYTSDANTYSGVIIAAQADRFPELITSARVSKLTSK